MPARLLHKAVSHPAVYDLVQRIAGAKRLKDRVNRCIPADLTVDARIIDVGGGTGGFRGIWPAGCPYVCVDLDLQKLHGLRAKHPDAAAICGDAARLPFANETAAAVTCALVSHHLLDATFSRALAEARRILVPGGALIFADALRQSSSMISRALWRYDRGSHPRSSQELRDEIETSFRIDYWEEITIWHRYAICVGRKT